MKPRRLTLQAFGPFANRQVIDFQNVFGGSLFLIHGKTGSGKTSILDGLCFALFGRPSVVERQKDLKALRSDHAPPDVITEAELEFFLGPDHYRILRIPSQPIPKKRGEGFTEYKATAELWIKKTDWIPLASKPEAVDREIESILGMDEVQFRQVVILPQGKFRDFLSSSSQARQEILERLFQTNRFSEFQTYLLKQQKTLELEWKTSTDQIISILSANGVGSLRDLKPGIDSRKIQAQELDEAYRRTKSSQKEVSELLSLVENIEVANLRLNSLLQDAEVINEKKAENEEGRKKIETYNKLVKYVSLQTPLKLNRERLKQTEDQLQHLTIDLTKVDSKLQTIHIRNQEFQQLNASCESLRIERQRFRDLYINLKNHIEKVTEKKQSLNALEKATLVSQKSLQASLTELGSAHGRLQALEDFHQQQLVEENIEVNKYTEAIKIQEYQYHLSQAAFLAQELKSGEPCPVCGSLDHPSPASALKASVTKEKLDSFRIQHQALIHEAKLTQSKRVSVLERLKKMLGTIEMANYEKLNFPAESIFNKKLPHDFKPLFFKHSQNLESLIERETQTLTTQNAILVTNKERSEQLDRELTELNVFTQKLSPEEQDLETIKTRGLDLTNQIEAIEKQQKHFEEESRSTEKTQIELRTRKTAAEDEILKLQKDIRELEELGFNELKAAGYTSGVPENLISANEKDQLEKLIAKYDARASQTNGAIEETKLNLDSLSKRLEVHFEAAKTLQDVDPNTTSKKVRELKEKSDSQAESLKELSAKVHLEIEKLEDVRKQIQLKEQALERLKEKSDQVIRLTSLITGDRSQNKLSVPLARFILQSRFEDMLEQANKRLGRMSYGRYQLKRPLLTNKLSQSQGLDISIQDALTGKDRHADSLSGGESFMAALSLALGLSDVIQNNLGGIRLDSVFVDEGFGTLDNESLELAIRTLTDLQSGGRMVGIISHVQELKNQIPHRLEVLASPTGSLAKWET